MKNRGKTLLVMSLLATSFILPLSSCENIKNDDGGDTKKDECVVKEIELSTTTLNMEVGEKKIIDIELIGSIDGEAIKNTKLTFSYDENIISFNERKLEVEALNIGSTELIITASNGVTNKITITVTKTILATSITSKFNRTKMFPGDKLKIDVDFSPIDVTNKDLKFTSTNRSVATVNKDGEIEAISEGTSVITVTYTASDIDSLSYSITVTQDEAVVKNDIALASISTSVENESNNIISGNIEITTKQNSIEEETFTNEYKIYDDHIYNNIKKYTSEEATKLYYGKDSEYIYAVEGDNKTYSKIGSSITDEKAQNMVSLPAFYADYYNSQYIYGVGAYIEDEIIQKVFLTTTNGSKTVVTSDENSLTMSLKLKDTIYYTQYNLHIEKDGDNLKSVTYTRDKYSVDYLDDDGNLKDDATKKEYYSFASSLTSGVKEKEENPEIDYNDFYYNDFDIEFKANENGKIGEASLTFNKGDTIIYDVTSFSPSSADGKYIDRIYIESISNTSIVEMAPNKMALNAVGVGTCKVVVASKKVKKEYTLTIVSPKVESFSLLYFNDTLKSNSSMEFRITYRPWGADYDFNVTLKEESKEYATLTTSERYGFVYYTLKAASNFSLDSKVVYLDITCASNPELNCTKEVTIVKALTSEEIYAAITEKTYTGTGTNDYTGELEFGTGDNANKGTFKMYIRNNVYDTVTFSYAISDDKLSIMNYSYDEGYLSSFKMTIIDATYSKIKVSVEDTYGDYEGDVYEFTLSK